MLRPLPVDGRPLVNIRSRGDLWSISPKSTLGAALLERRQLLLHEPDKRHRGTSASPTAALPEPRERLVSRLINISTASWNFYQIQQRSRSPESALFRAVQRCTHHVALDALEAAARVDEQLSRTHARTHSRTHTHTQPLGSMSICPYRAMAPACRPRHMGLPSVVGTVLTGAYRPGT